MRKAIPQIMGTDAQQLAQLNRVASTVQQALSEFDTKVPHGVLVETCDVVDRDAFIGKRAVLSYVGPGGHTITLNSASGLGNGVAPIVLIQHNGKGTLTVSALGKELIAGFQKFYMWPGQVAMFVSDGGSSWIVGPREESKSWDSYAHTAGGGGLTTWNLAACNNATALVTIANPAQNTLLAYPFHAPARGGTLTGLQFEVTTLSAGNGRMGIYEITAENNIYPGALVVDGGSISTGTTGVKTATVSAALRPGKRYWICFVTDAGPTVRAVSLAQMPILGIAAGFGTTPNVGLTKAFTYAALPATFPTGATFITTGAQPALAYLIGD